MYNIMVSETNTLHYITHQMTIFFPTKLRRYKIIPRYQYNISLKVYVLVSNFKPVF